MDAIVRPQLTKHISIQSPPISIQSGYVVLLQQEKVFEKIRGWGSGPPLFQSFPVLPPPTNPSQNDAKNKGRGGLPILGGVYKRAERGDRSLSDTLTGSGNGKTQGKATPTQGFRGLTGSGYL